MFDAAPPYVAVAFWLGLATVICVWIVVASMQRRRALSAIRAAIEREKPLDAETVRLLLGKPSRAESRRALLVQACVWTALGPGFALWAIIGFGKVHMVLLGIGGVMLSIGLGLLAAVHFGYRGAQDDDAGS